MAEKHKSKHKTPKDFAKSLKAETRKDMKDYTAEDAPNMVPGGVKGVQPNVPRKYATDVIDNIENMVPEIKNRLYKKIEEGEYSAKDARKVFEKLQIEDAEEFLKKLERIDHGAITNSMVKPENEEKLQERVNRLSAENKDRLIREYVRRKIAIMIREAIRDNNPNNQTQDNEQPATDPTAVTIDTSATDTPATDPTAVTPDPQSTDTPATDPTADTPATDTTADTPTADTPTADTPATDAPATDTPADTPDPDAQLQAEKGPWEQAQDLLINRLKTDPRWQDKSVAVVLNFLKNTIQKIEAEKGEDISKNEIKRSMLHWMHTNKYFG